MRYCLILLLQFLLTSCYTWGTFEHIDHDVEYSQSDKIYYALYRPDIIGDSNRVFSFDIEAFKPKLVEMNYDSIGSIFDIRFDERNNLLWLKSSRNDSSQIQSFDFDSKELKIVYKTKPYIWGFTIIDSTVYFEMRDPVLVKGKEYSRWVYNLYRMNINTLEVEPERAYKFDASIRLRKVNDSYLYIYGHKNDSKKQFLYNVEKNLLEELKQVHKKFNRDNFFYSGIPGYIDVSYSDQTGKYYMNEHNKIFEFEYKKNTRMRKIVELGKYDQIRTIIKVSDGLIHCFVRQMRTGKKKIVVITTEGDIVFNKVFPDKGLEKYYQE